MSVQIDEMVSNSVITQHQLKMEKFRTNYCNRSIINHLLAKKSINFKQNGIIQIEVLNSLQKCKE